MVTSAGAYWKKSAEAEGSMECTVLQLSQATAWASSFISSVDMLARWQS